MPNFSGSFSGRATSQTTIALEDIPNHDLNLLGDQRRPENKRYNWKDAKITCWGTADLVGGSGPQRGYSVDVHANGDRDIGTFEGKVKTDGGEVTIEGTWKYVDGTGQFKGVTGGGTYKGRMTVPTEIENTWEGTYQLAALPAVRVRSSRPCQSTAEILFAHTLQAKMKSATRFVTGSSRQTLHAGGTAAALTRRDLCRARDISNSLDLNLPLSPIR
jgi:hypothetical protein